MLEQREVDRIELYAACLMPDHLHMLLGAKRLGLIEFVDAWKSWTTRLSWSFGHRGGLWQPGMWDRTIRDERDFETTVEYIVTNPVVAGLADGRDEWPWKWAWYDDESRGDDSWRAATEGRDS